MKINPTNKTDRDEWSRSSFTDGKQISTAKPNSPIDWTVKAMFDDMLARETQTRRLGAYKRGYKNGV